MKKKGLHTILGLSKNVPPGQVKKAYRAFVRRNHPDLHPGNAVREELFKRVNAAYQQWKTIEGTLESMRRIKQESLYRAGYPDYDRFTPWRIRIKA